MAKETQKQHQAPVIPNIPSFPPPPPPKPARVQIILASAAALGNGTRPAGFVLGTAEPFDVGYDPLSVEPAEGVERIELRNVLLNPHLIELR